MQLDIHQCLIDYQEIDCFRLFLVDALRTSECQTARFVRCRATPLSTRPTAITYRRSASAITTDPIDRETETLIERITRFTRDRPAALSQSSIAIFHVYPSSSQENCHWLISMGTYRHNHDATFALFNLSPAVDALAFSEASQFRSLVLIAHALLAHRQFLEPPDSTMRRPGARALTSRQREIVELIAAGMSTKEIAKRLKVSPYTIHNTVRRMLANHKMRKRMMLCGLLTTSVSMTSASRSSVAS